MFGDSPGKVVIGRESRLRHVTLLQLEPPDDVVPEVVALTVNLVKNDWLFARLDCFRVWPNGVTFFLRVRRRSQSDDHPELYFKATQIGEPMLRSRSLATASETARGRAA